MYAAAWFMGCHAPSCFGGLAGIMREVQIALARATSVVQSEPETKPGQPTGLRASPGCDAVIVAASGMGHLQCRIGCRVTLMSVSADRHWDVCVHTPPGQGDERLTVPEVLLWVVPPIPSELLQCVSHLHDQTVRTACARLIYGLRHTAQALSVASWNALTTLIETFEVGTSGQESPHQEGQVHKERLRWARQCFATPGHQCVLRDFAASLPLAHTLTVWLLQYEVDILAVPREPAAATAALEASGLVASSLCQGSGGAVLESFSATVRAGYVVGRLGLQRELRTTRRSFQARTEPGGTGRVCCHCGVAILQADCGCTCFACQTVYCSKLCMAEAWPSHRYECEGVHCAPPAPAPAAGHTLPAPAGAEGHTTGTTPQPSHTGRHSAAEMYLHMKEFECSMQRCPFCASSWGLKASFPLRSFLVCTHTVDICDVICKVCSLCGAIFGPWDEELTGGVFVFHGCALSRA